MSSEASRPRVVAAQTGLRVTAIIAVGARQQALDANNPDLRAFNRRGGKLLMYHGFADPFVTPLASVDYYTAMIGANGATGASKIGGILIEALVHPGDGCVALILDLSGLIRVATRSARAA